MRTKFISFAFLILFFACFGFHTDAAHAQAAPWYNNNWQLRREITINSALVGGGTEDESNFPVLISLTGLSNINANGTDIRFTDDDGVTLLPREIESYASGTLVAWVNVPTVSHVVSTSIYMYYGNTAATEPAATSPDGSQAVWSNGYAGVWHLDEGGGNTAYDSTANGHSGAFNNPPEGTNGYYSPGIISPWAGTFNAAVNNAISTGLDAQPSALLQTTWTAWIDPTVTTGDRSIMNDDQGSYGRDMFSTLAGDGNYHVFYGNGNWNVASAPINQWQLVSLVYASNDVYFYLNGTKHDLGQAPGQPASGSGFIIGAGSFTGLISNVSVTSVPRSAGWESTEYLNQSSPSNFYLVGSPTASDISPSMPAIALLSPAIGNVVGDATVTISGTGFSGITAVTFGSTPAASFTVNSSSSITATSPAGSTGTVDVAVTNAAGTSPITAGDHFTYYSTATITGLSGISSGIAGGTTITISGVGLAPVTAVRFGSTPAASFTVNSDTSITATSPAGSTGTVDVAVTTPLGVSSPNLTDQFLYTSSPSAPAFTPSSTMAFGASTISATGFEALPYFSPDGTNYYEASSYDRAGNNGDAGQYLFQDPNGNYVLMDVKGAGELDRIWITDTSLTNRIEIYFDGETTPRVNMTLGDILSGNYAPFLRPLVGYSNSSQAGTYMSGFYISLPMAFAHSVKIETVSPSYYNVDYRMFATSTGVTTFTPTSTDPNYQDSTAAAAIWNNSMSDPKSTAGNIGSSGTLTIGGSSPASVATISGAGSINSIKIRVGANNDNDATLDNVRIKMYWDGETTPSVDVPFNMFFANSQNGTTHALPVGKDASGTYYSYFPMPYDTSAKIVIDNENNSAISLGYSVQYNAAPYLGLGNSAGYFNAYYNDSSISPLVSGQDYALLNLTGEKGQIVGMVYNSTYGGNLEGNAEVYVDGSLTPQIQGTGTEDWFSGAYYWNDGSFTQATHGVIISPGTTTVEAYRFDLNDPVSFNDSIKLGMQHGGTDDGGATVSSVAFYYALPNSGISTMSDSLAVGSSTSEAAHTYTVSGQTSTSTNAYYYEGEAQGHYGPLITDSGDALTGYSQFTVAIDPSNKGVLLRRRLNYTVANQEAEVYVDGALVGIWYDAGNNTTLSWRDSEFVIPAAYTQNKNSLTIKIMYDPSEGAAWTEYDYWISSYVDIDDTAPVTTASIPSGSYGSDQTVSLSCSDGSAAGCYRTYYTTDGTDPTMNSTVYASSITVSGDTTLKFSSIDLAGNFESANTETYEFSSPSGSSPSSPSVQVASGGGGYSAPTAPTVTSTSTTTSTSTLDVSSASTSSLQAMIDQLTIELEGLELQVSGETHFTRNLSYGMQGADVMELQQYLIAQNSGPAARLLKVHGVTKNFAMLTLGALIEFQKASGITPAAGYFGPITRAYIAKQ